MSAYNRPFTLRWVASSCVLLMFCTPNSVAAQCRPTLAAASAPVLPIQFTTQFNPQAAVAGDSPRTPDETERLNTIYTVPIGRYLIVESIAVKGTHPPGSYLALELETSGVFEGPPANRPFASVARHFLYARDVSDHAAAVHIREAMRVIASPNTAVKLGAQWTKGAKPEMFAVTLTGTLVDSCRWGQ